ncbi:hypothetical protein QBC34DRAFT_405843 [Podospora aff. communis PSN243]|uniref:Heterokaryon incompatibility domain-containing protein n=1 Tax=Podospora aff. communis PSN243 TaxID=3040156 RepID=A0AAV9GNZ5_9PEZI|nr:hypothetical protein QBC34DRAFT_405843 [Podospora aff. communis PSN243]
MVSGPLEEVTLFKIAPVNLPNGSLRCWTNTFKWEQRPAFDAISITWEEGPPDDTIWRDDDLAKAPGALVECLKQLERDGRTDSFYWVCTIGYGDGHGGYRVDLPDIAAVFSAAENVICWLGPLLPGAFDSLPQLCTAHQRAVDLGTDMVAALDQYQRKIADISPSAWGTLDKLLSLRFFTRSWIAVEVICSNKPVVYCGSLKVEWDDLCFALRGCDLYACPSRIKSNGLQTLLSIDAARAYRMSTKPSPWPGVLVQYVLTALTSPAVGAKDPMDRIRGASSILRETHKMHRLRGTSQEGPTFKTFAVGLNAILRRPFTLSMTGGSGSQLAQTSWVPDWATPRTRLTLDAPDARFSASPVEPYKFERTPWDRLDFTGLAAGRVAATAGYMPLRRHTDHFGASDGNAFFLGQWFDWAEDNTSRIRRHGEKDVLLQFAETIQAHGCGWKYAAAMPADRNLFRERARQFLGFLENEDADESYEIRLFYAACYPAHGRVFGITSHGCLCLLPRGAAAGDVVCIPHGARVPALLRVVGDCYHNLGECYIHGMMHGEADTLAGTTTRRFQIQ